MRTILTAMLVLTLAGAAWAEDKNNAPMRTTITGGAIVTLVGSDTVPAAATTSTTADSAVTPIVEVEVDSPIRFVEDRAAVMRVYGRLGISSEPDSTVSLSDVATFKSGELGLGIKHYFGDVSVVGEWGFAARLPSGPEPLTRTTRHWGVGVGVGDPSGPNLTMIYGRDEAAGDTGWGQIMVWGGVPIAGTEGSIILFGDATVNVGPRERTGVVAGQPAFAAGDQPINQRDIFRLGVAVDIGSAIKALKK